jgi:tetratricopeptide (TPR) repeat protein
MNGAMNGAMGGATGGAGSAASAGAAGATPADQPGEPPGDAGATPAGVMPFWQRMPRLFLFPLQRPPLMRNLVISALSCALACLLFARSAAAPLQALAWFFLVFCAESLYIAQFCFLVIERTASGYLDSRAYPRTAEAADWGRPIKMFLVLVFVPVFIGVVGHFLPPFLGKVALFAWALLLPASVMVMTLTDSFAEAVNPVRCLNTALAIGTPYLLLCLYLVLLNFGFHEVTEVVLHGASLALQVVPAGKDGAAAAPPATFSVTGFGLLAFGFIAVANYFFILTCALIGYAMYQYSEVLGVSVVGPGETRTAVGAPSAAGHARRQREALIGKMVAAGEVREALELINNELAQRPNDLSLHVRLHTLLVHEGSSPKIETHAERYLQLLLAASSTRDALALWEQTRAKFPAFMPRDPAHWTVLADEALAAGKPALAAELIRGFDRKFPGHPNVPDAYLVGARVLLQGGQPDQAQQLLNFVVSTYPKSAAAVEAKRYLQRFAT